MRFNGKAEFLAAIVPLFSHGVTRSFINHSNMFRKRRTIINNWMPFITELKISILEWFLKDYVTENWSNDAENSDFPSQEYILKYITIEKLF